MQLTDLEIRRAKPAERDYKLNDGKGLYLHVTKAGSRIWRYRYRLDGVERLLTVGHYPKISLANARSARELARQKVKEGIDPSAAKQEAEQEAIANGEAPPKETFEQVAREWHAMRERTWGAVHATNVLDSLVKDVFPKIGVMAMDAITSRKILHEVCKPVEQRGAIETSHRIRQRISGIFQYAMAGDRAKEDPAATIGKALAPVIKRKLPAVKDMEPAREMLRRAEKTPSAALTKLAHRFLALVVLRPGPFLTTPWTELPEGIEDEAKPVWVVPAKRMKLGQEQKADDSFDFFIPLSTQAQECIRVIRTLSGTGKWVFPNHGKIHKPMSDAAINYLLNRAGYYGRHVPHGWRTTFSTLMNEREPRDFKLIDICLAHSGKGKVEGVYNRAAYIEHRRELMQIWANLLLEGMPPAESLLDGPHRHNKLRAEAPE